jgi:hypothetical protein
VHDRAVAATGSPSSRSPSSQSPASRPPAFVACGARSGSTLLRWLIDAHPEVACPPESEVAALADAWVRSAGNLGLAPDGADGSRAAVRRAVEAMMAAAPAVAGKPAWCDKSLGNVEHLETLASVWPDARFLLLYRGSMDFVVSALEAQPWGFLQYGLSSFLQPGQPNNVLSLVNYWMDRTVRMLSFSERHAQRCLMLRYEDLVTDTETVLGSIWDHLGVEPMRDAATVAFGERPAGGAADYKIWFSDGIRRDSVGRGWRVPAEMVRDPFRTMMNDLLAKLGYPQVDDGWGSAGGAPAGTVPASSIRLLEVRVVEGTAVVWNRRADLDASSLVPAAPRASGSGAGEAALPLIVAERASLAGLLEGRTGLAEALRSRTVRPYGISFSGYPDERSLYDRLLPLLKAAGVIGALS